MNYSVNPISPCSLHFRKVVCFMFVVFAPPIIHMFQPQQKVLRFSCRQVYMYLQCCHRDLKQWTNSVTLWTNIYLIINIWGVIPLSAIRCLCFTTGVRDNVAFSFALLFLSPSSVVPTASSCVTATFVLQGSKAVKQPMHQNWPPFFITCIWASSALTILFLIIKEALTLSTFKVTCRYIGAEVHYNYTSDITNEPVMFVLGSY